MVRADQQVPTVMAASILAKTHRDTYMKSLDSKYDIYDFKSNVGYASKHNLKGMEVYGLSDLHRRSYKVKKLAYLYK